MNKKRWRETKKKLKVGDVVRVSYIRRGLPQKRKMTISKIFDRGISFISRPNKGTKFYINFETIKGVEKV